ncbi:MAG: protein kinase [Parachlamydiaceae bacterium]|nr:protein kinase [Parachlamydiaceae bacterium]
MSLNSPISNGNSPNLLSTSIQNEAKASQVTLHKDGDRLIMSEKKEIKRSAPKPLPKPNSSATARSFKASAPNNLANGVVAKHVYSPLKDVETKLPWGKRYSPSISAHKRRQKPSTETIGKSKILPTLVQIEGQETKVSQKTSISKDKLKNNLEDYKKFKKEINKINKYAAKNMKALTDEAKMSDQKSFHITGNNANNFSIKEKHIYKLTAKGKYGLTITDNGEVFVNVPASKFAQGGEKEISFAVRLSNSFSIGSRFNPLHLPKIKNSQISVFGLSLTSKDSMKEALRDISGEVKVMNSSIQNTDHILIPKAITHIVTTNEEGVELHKTGVIMPFCDGGDLRNKVFDTKNKAGLAEFKVIAEGVSNGLVELHKAGLSHRDLKPENMMIHNGVVKIADFGGVVSDRDFEYTISTEDLNSFLEMIGKNGESESIREKFKGIDGLRNNNSLNSKIVSELREYAKLLKDKESDPKIKALRLRTNSIVNKYDGRVGSLLFGSGTSAYLPLECEIKADLSTPKDSSKYRDVYSLGVSLFQLTHEISPKEIELEYKSLIKNLANGYSLEIIDNNYDEVATLINEKEKELIIAQIQSLINNKLISNDDKFQHLKEKDIARINQLYKEATKSSANKITDFKELKECAKMPALKKMLDNFKSESKNNPPSEPVDQMILKLLDDIPANRGNAEEALAAIKKF